MQVSGLIVSHPFVKFCITGPGQVFFHKIVKPRLIAQIEKVRVRVDHLTIMKAGTQRPFKPVERCRDFILERIQTCKVVHRGDIIPVEIQRFLIMKRCVVETAHVEIRVACPYMRGCVIRPSGQNGLIEKQRHVEFPLAVRPVRQPEPVVRIVVGSRRGNGTDVFVVKSRPNGG